MTGQPSPAAREVFAGTHVRVVFDPDKKGIARCALVNADLAFATADTARKGMEFAIGISPRSNRNEPGHRHYQDSFNVEPGVVWDIGKPPMARISARIINDSPQATVVEVGDGRAHGGTKARRILRQTLEHLNNANPVRQ